MRLFENVEAFFALAAADDLADAGDEHVHGPHGFAVVVDAHVERLQRARIIVQDDGVLEVLLGQDSVRAPIADRCPTSPGYSNVLPDFEQDIDRLGVGDAQERRFQDAFEPGQRLPCRCAPAKNFMSSSHLLKASVMMRLMNASASVMLS